MIAGTVESPRQNATQYLTGGYVAGDQVDWVIEIAGHFEDHFDIRPAIGTALTLYINTKTFAEDGFGLGNKWVDLSHLGPVVALK